MVSYNIFISCIYALYSIFKDEIPDFMYNKVSTSANVREMVTQTTAGFCGLFWIKEVFLNTKIIKSSRKCNDFHYANSVSLQGAITLYRYNKIN